MKKSILMLFAVLFCAGCMNFKYEGKKAEPVESCVFLDKLPEDRKYEMLGKAAVSGDYQSFSLPDMKEKLRKNAAEYGANAVIITSQQVVPNGDAVVEPEPYVAVKTDNADLDYSLNKLDRDFSFGYGSAGKKSAETYTKSYIRIVRADFIRLDDASVSKADKTASGTEKSAPETPAGGKQK